MVVRDGGKAAEQVPARSGARDRGHSRFWFWAAVVPSVASAYIAIELAIRIGSAGYYLPVRAESGEHVPKWRFRIETEGAWRWMYRWHYETPADIGDTRWLRYREIYQKVHGEREALSPADLSVLGQLAATLDQSPAPPGGDRSPGAFEPPELRKRAAILGFDFWALTAAELQICREIIEGYAPPLGPEDTRLLERLLEWAPLTPTERKRMEEDVARNRANNRLHRWAAIPCCLLYLLAPVAFLISASMAVQRIGTRRRLLLLLCVLVSAAGLAFVRYTTYSAHIW